MGDLSRYLTKQCILTLTPQRGCNKSRLSLHEPWGALGYGLRPSDSEARCPRNAHSAEGLTECSVGQYMDKLVFKNVNSCLVHRLLASMAQSGSFEHVVSLVPFNQVRKKIGIEQKSKK